MHFDPERKNQANDPHSLREAPMSLEQLSKLAAIKTLSPSYFTAADYAQSQSADCRAQ